MVSSNITIEIDSRRCSRTYEVLRFSEFDVSLDLETDADTFDIVAENPNGVYTGLFCRFDNCRLKINGKEVLHGNLDSVTYYISGNKDYIKLTGRDLCWLLVDNDALPDTIEGLQPKKYIEHKCASYGIKCNVSDADVYDKLVIGCEESEISIMNNILLDSRQRIWYSVDTLYTGFWATGANPSYVFVMSTSHKGIPIMSVEFKEDGTDMIAKMLVYGSDGEGGQKIMGQYDNQYMINKGIKKRSVKRHYSDSAASKYTSVAERNVRDKFRDDTELTISVPIEAVYMPNTTAQVVIDRLGINAVFFIKSIQYVKGIDDGGKAMIRLIPADSTFEKLWNSSTAISLTNFTKLSSKLANQQVSNVYSTTSINASYDDRYISVSSQTGDDIDSSNSGYFPMCSYTGVSIVDGLKSVGANSSYTYRSSIASANGISDYRGTSAQNTQMLNLLKAGKLKRP